MKKVEHPSPEGALLNIYSSIVEEIKQAREFKGYAIQKCRDVVRDGAMSEMSGERVDPPEQLTKLYKASNELERWKVLEARSVDWEFRVWHLIRMFDLRRNRAKLDGLHEYEPPKKTNTGEAA